MRAYELPRESLAPISKLSSVDIQSFPHHFWLKEPGSLVAENKKVISLFYT